MNEIKFTINSNPINIGRDIVEAIRSRNIKVSDVQWVHRTCKEPSSITREWFETNKDYTVTIGVRMNVI